jgi:hypothetical protein
MFDVLSPDKLAKIRELNDTFRMSFAGGKIVMTANVAELPDMVRAAALTAVAEFDGFNAENDPAQEHDFGSFKLCNLTFFWQISYFDVSMQFGSEDPADTAKTARVLTLMLNVDF